MQLKSKAMNKMKHLYITFFCVFLAHFASAKLVIGKILDEDSVALRNVKVEWIIQGVKVDKKLRDRMSDLRIAYTAKDGTYKIQIPLGADTTYSLKFSLPGMQPRVISSKEFKFRYNEVNLSLEKLGAVSISGSNFQRSVYEIPASVVIVTREEIADFGYSTVQEVLENVPGLYTVDHRSMTDVSIGIRGFMSDFNRNVMIQVNGVSMMSDRENDYPLSKINIPVQAIDKIEIIRGPMSVISGSGAFFGVINIITNTAAEAQSATVSTGIGNPGIRNVYANYSAYKEGFLISFNAMSEQRNGFDENWRDLMFDTTLYTFSNGAVNADRYSRKHQGVNLSVDYEGFFSNINYAVSDKGFSFLVPSPEQRNDYKSRTLHTEFGYARRKSQRFKFEVKMRYTNSVVDHQFKYDANTYTPGEDRSTSIRTQFNTKTTIYSDNLTSQKDARYAVYLLSGLAYNRNFENYSLYNSPKFENRNWYLGLKPGTAAETTAGYGQVEVKLNKFQLIAGLRYERLSDYQMYYEANNDLANYTIDSISGTNENGTFEPTPRFAAMYSSANDTSGISHHVRAMYSGAYNHSAVVINTLDVMAALRDSAEQTDYMEPEKMKSYEVGYTFIHRERNLEAGINLFYNDLDKLITRSTKEVDGKFVSISKNESAITTFGTEIMGKITFPKKSVPSRLHIQTSMSLTLQRTKRSGDDSLVLVSYSPQQLAKMSVRGNYTFDNDLRLSFGVSSNYISSMSSYYAPESADTLGGIVPGGFIGTGSDPYFRFAANIRLSNFAIANLIAGKSIKEKYGTMFINLKLENIGNYRYKYPTDAANTWADKGLFGRGRSFLCTIGYKF
jgi:outer membrane receptor for ferrienterochelin and colicin